MKENQAVRLIISAVCHQPHFIFPDGGNIPLKHSVLFAHPQTFFLFFSGILKILHPKNI